ncbi:MAG TPA: hypothetical protein VM433_03620 [Mycobacteriales bacterium]|nr:hypothetical protein [Egibacteraceae bacterium]HVM26743.1 hypothetical protein [Mycobacteriales bacterium]
MSQLDSDAQSPVALLLRQVEGIDAWNLARQARERVLHAGPLSRQEQFEARRRIDLLAHAHATVLACASSDLAKQPAALGGAIGRRAVVAHRHLHFADRLSQALSARGVQVIGASENGAEALGVVVAEQPDLLVIGDALVMLSAAELLSEVALFAPSTFRAVQVSNSNGVGLMLDAGAHSVFTRQLSQEETADQLLALLEPRVRTGHQVLCSDRDAHDARSRRRWDA